MKSYNNRCRKGSLASSGEWDKTGRVHPHQPAKVRALFVRGKATTYTKNHMALLIKNVNETLNTCIRKWLHQSIKKRVKDFKQSLIP